MGGIGESWTGVGDEFDANATAADALDHIAADLLVTHLIEGLTRETTRPSAADALRQLYVPQLPQRLHERFQGRYPPVVEALHGEAVCRYRQAWSDTWSAPASLPAR